MGKTKSYIFLFFILLMALILNLKMGFEEIAWTRLMQFDDVILQLRFKSAITSMLAGVGLSLAGLMMQNLFRNPLAGPSVLGVTSFSSLSISLFLLAVQKMNWQMVLLNSYSLQFSLLFFSCLGAVLCLLVLMFFSRKSNVLSHLLIVGMMIATFCSGIVQVIDILLNKDNLQSLTLWNLGSFKDTNTIQILILLGFVVVGIFYVFYQVKISNIYQLGDEYAQGLGVNLKSYKRNAVLLAALLSAVVTAFCGPIGFVGLAVPHIARFITKSNDMRILVPYSIFIGAIVCLICNMLSNLYIFDFALPVNAITSLIGAPFTIYLLIKLRQY